MRRKYSIRSIEARIRSVDLTLLEARTLAIRNRPSAISGDASPIVTHSYSACHNCAWARLV